MIVKRRRFCRYVVLSSACFAGVIGRDFASAENSQSSPAKSHHKWVVLYWMPYDNDLSRFGEFIIEMLTHGTQNSEVAVIVQSDYWGDPRMRRRRLTDGKMYEADITGEDSSDVAAFSAYLDWAGQTFEAEHWAVVVMGHGGRINEVSPDDHKLTNKLSDRPRTWMGVDQFAEAVSRFNRAINEQVELLFFQNCNKATVEVVYEVRNCARYTLASQLTLGAPNDYYEGFLNTLKEPSIDGREAAIAIMDSEQADMYHTLTLVDNQAVKCIPKKLSPLLQSILGGQIPVGTLSRLPAYHYCGEQHCDVLGLLSHLSKVGDRHPKEFAEFAEFLCSSVIAHHKTGGELYSRQFLRESNLEGLCGLSLYLPETEQAIARYTSLALYQAIDLIGIYRKINSSA